MEIADIFYMNKSDHPQAREMAAHVRSVLEIGHDPDPISASEKIFEGAQGRWGMMPGRITGERGSARNTQTHSISKIVVSRGLEERRLEEG